MIQMVPTQIPTDRQRGINMVDLMMWLVIAALMLATALQGIGFYQKATFYYQAKSDLSGAQSWTLANIQKDAKVPDSDSIESAIISGDLKLTTNGEKSNEVTIASKDGRYCVGVRALMIEGDNLFYSTSDAPSEVTKVAELPAECGGGSATGGGDNSGAVNIENVITGLLEDNKLNASPPFYEKYAVEKCVDTDTKLKVRCILINTYSGILATIIDDEIFKSMIDNKVGMSEAEKYLPSDSLAKLQRNHEMVMEGVSQFSELVATDEHLADKYLNALTSPNASDLEKIDAEVISGKISDVGTLHARFVEAIMPTFEFITYMKNNPL